MTYVMTEPCIDAAALDSQDRRSSSPRIGWTHHPSMAPKSPRPRIRRRHSGVCSAIMAARYAWESPVSRAPERRRRSWFGTASAPRARLAVGAMTCEVFRLQRVEGAAGLPYSLKVSLENLLRNEYGAGGWRAGSNRLSRSSWSSTTRSSPSLRPRGTSLAVLAGAVTAEPRAGPVRRPTRSLGWPVRTNC